jgi:uncharacterized membrane protein YoaK (UPF0700 family)
MPVLSDIRDTLVPGRGTRHGPLPPLLIVLTVVTGLIDAFSYLVLGHVFVANMTGNVVFLGMALAGAKGFSAADSLTALGGFVVGAWASGMLAARHGGRRGRMLAATVGAEVVLVAVATMVAGVSHHPDRGGARLALLVMLAVAAGAQNGTAQKLDVPDLSTTVLTRTITGMARDGRVAGGADSHIGRRGLAVVAMLLGALVGTTCVLHLHQFLDLALALVLLVPVAVVAFLSSRSRAAPAWEAPV